MKRKMRSRMDKYFMNGIGGFAAVFDLSAYRTDSIARSLVEELVQKHGRRYDLSTGVKRK